MSRSAGWHLSRVLGMGVLELKIITKSDGFRHNFCQSNDNIVCPAAFGNPYNVIHRGSPEYSGQ